MAFNVRVLLLQRVLLILIMYIVTISGPKLSVCAKSFTIANYCKETIWPGITHNENFSGGGFALKPGQSAVYTAPPGWNGRIWGRTGCNFDKNGNGKCQTGGCGDTINCTGPGSPPATIADFTLGDTDFYDVSLVDGFNLPIVVKPLNGGKGNCSTAGCDGDLRQSCPSELQAKSDGKVIACRSACEVFNTDEYCCRGNYGNPVACLPTNYSKAFKQFCPAAYSFAYDDPTSVITCSGADFAVTFCASRNQTVCSYHNQTLGCNGAKSLQIHSQRWWGIVFLALLPLMLTLF
ncbi:pathogenesis-related thaumatin-like protein 3.5 [Ziziphus jujuba]|uniref:Pathogenesis-related thaumatin-like protein 3.5 n=1 Tax=Ziziphus jujuba TaxID=326968 RepID=A0A6P4AEF1_ZIZJJ|nr:pathogenesis-related thaumatin-like protein 3.5 [Ziziphus jujuba]